MAQRLNHQKGGMLNLSLSKGSTLRFSCRPQDAVSQLLRCLRMGVGGSYARTGTPQAAPSATYNVNNQLTQWKGASLTYDANGNLTSDGTNTYTWNARNQLVSVSGPVPASFQYDPFGRRVSKTIGGTTQYLYDGANPVQEISGTSASANLLTGGEDEYLQRTDSAGARSFLTDALGSTLALADSTGALQTQYTFEPFGNTSTTGTATANSFAYTGRELDATGLYFYRARYYNPALGRFISEDPLGFGSGDTNLYSYVGNRPLDYNDPSGKTPAVVAIPVLLGAGEGVLAATGVGAVVVGLTGLAIYDGIQAANLIQAEWLSCDVCLGLSRFDPANPPADFPDVANPPADWVPHPQGGQDRYLDPDGWTWR